MVDLRRHAVEYARRGTPVAEDEFFDAEQNARVIKNAEAYYRRMVEGRDSAWNSRDRHMADTLDALAGHLTHQRGEPAKVVVWAHNSHVGDASATEVAARGEVDVGQLVRERHPNTRLIGFTTYTGTVTAAADWNGLAERVWVRPALPGSVEELFHETDEEEFIVSFPRATRSTHALRSARVERAIGVVYRPRTERRSHYFQARLADQFDAVIHIDQTRAVEPIEPTAEWERGEVPETYPFAV